MLVDKPGDYIFNRFIECDLGSEINVSVRLQYSDHGLYCNSSFIIDIAL